MLVTGIINMMLNTLRSYCGISRIIEATNMCLEDLMMLSSHISITSIEDID